MSDRTGSFVLALLFFGIAGLLVPPSVSAQNAASNDRAEFVSGTVVLASGDTLSGEVRSWRRARTPDVVHFRARSSDPVKTYSATDVRSVERADERRLVRRSIRLDQVPRDPDVAARFLESGEPSMKADTVLVEVATGGPLHLYFRQGARNRYFVESDGQTVELIQRRWKTETRQDANVVATSDRYRQQLERRMTNCPEVQEEAGRVDLELTDLREIVLRYNRCVTGSSPSQMDAPATDYWSSLQTSVAVEATSGWSYLADQAERMRRGFGGGISLIVRKAQSDARWSLRFGARGAYESIAYLQGSIDRTVVGVDGVFRYYVRTGRIAPYVEGGLAGLVGVSISYPPALDLPVNRPLDESFDEGFEVGSFGGLGTRIGPVSVGGRARARSSIIPSKPAVSYEVVLGYEF